MRNTTQTLRRNVNRSKVRDISRELPPRPDTGSEESIDYAQICKELGRYDDGLDVLGPVIRSGELKPENWNAYALAGFFNLQRGDSAVCRTLMKQAINCLQADRRYYNCMRSSGVYNHFAYHYDYQLLSDTCTYLNKKVFRQVLFQQTAVGGEGIVFLTEAFGRKIIALDLLGNFLWGKSLNLVRKDDKQNGQQEDILMSSGYGEGITIVDNATGDMIQMDREGCFKTMAPLGSRFFKVHSFTQDYFGCIFVTEENPMRLSIYEPDGKLQREIYLDEVMDYNSDASPFSIIYDEEGFLHLYNIDVLLTLNGEGRKIFRKDILTSGKAKKDWQIISKGLACDNSGHIYIVRPSENRIIVIDKAMGTELGEIGPKVGETKLKRPTDIAIDLDDNIFINDSGNARILKIETSTGNVLTHFQLPHWKFV